jgi:hypothetical protein
MNTDTKAVLLCVLATAIVGWLFLYHGKSATTTTLDLGFSWFVIANWLGRRGVWLMRLGAKDIFQEARRGSLRLSGVARWIDRGADVLFLTAAVCLIVDLRRG